MEPNCDCSSAFHCLDYVPPAREIDPTKLVNIDYTNYRQERGYRVVEPISIWFGKTDFHEVPQWLLKAWDVEKKAERDFAIMGIHNWTTEIW